jgi:hypothetical protein
MRRMNVGNSVRAAHSTSSISWVDNGDVKIGLEVEIE